MRLTRRRWRAASPEVGSIVRGGLPARQDQRASASPRRRQRQPPRRPSSATVRSRLTSQAPSRRSRRPYSCKSPESGRRTRYADRPSCQCPQSPEAGQSSGGFRILSLPDRPSAFVYRPFCEKHANTSNENRTAASALGMVKVQRVAGRVRWSIPSETPARSTTGEPARHPHTRVRAKRRPDRRWLLSAGAGSVGLVAASATEQKRGTSGERAWFVSIGLRLQRPVLTHPKEGPGGCGLAHPRSGRHALSEWLSFSASVTYRA
jgi:hypothetical protein